MPTKTLGTPVARSARKKRLALQCVAWASLAGPLPHLLFFARDGIPTQSNKLPTTAQWTCELGLPLLRVDLLRWRCCGWFLLLVFFGHGFFGRHRREWQSTAGPELEERTTAANDTVKAKANRSTCIHSVKHTRKPNHKREPLHCNRPELLRNRSLPDIPRAKRLHFQILP